MTEAEMAVYHALEPYFGAAATVSGKAGPRGVQEIVSKKIIADLNERGWRLVRIDGSRK